LSLSAHHSLVTNVISAVAPKGLYILLWLAVLWIALGFAGMLRTRNTRFIAHLLFPLGAIVCLGVALLAGIFLATGHAPQIAILPLGLPNLPFHARLDTLSGFFLLLVGLAGAGISIFAAGYFRSGEGTAPGLLCLEYHLFLASMALVVLADDAYFFMVAWETMALSSYFLVTSQHRIAEIRRAGFLYLLMAHVDGSSLLMRCVAPRCHRSGLALLFYLRCLVSVPRQAWFPCMYGCRRRILRHPPRSPP
jgi:hydrogenase-4 component B